MDSMSFSLARRTIKYYGCSTCWGSLKMEGPDESGGYVVVCENCGDETKGYVSQKYIEKRRGESISDERQAKKVLIEAGILPDPMAGKTQEQKLKELGY